MTNAMIPRQRSAGASTLIVGAGQAGTSLARDLHRVKSFGLAPDRLPRRRPAASSDAGSGPRRCWAPSTTWSGCCERDAAPRCVVIAIPSMRRAEIQSSARRRCARGVAGAPPAAVPGRPAAGDRGHATCATSQVGSLIGRDEMHVRQPRGRRGDHRQAGAGHRGRRLDRQRAVPPDPRLRPEPAGDARPRRVQPAPAAARARAGEALLDTDATVVADIRDRGADPPDLPRAPPAGRLPRRCPQAPARCWSGTPARA